MTGAMYAAIAGLKTHMQNLNVIGNNIANVNTYGYKASRAVFKSSLYSTLSGGSNGTVTMGGTNPSQIGYGSNVASVDVDMSTGNYAVTGMATDMMLDGDGFFLVGSKEIALNFDGSSDDINRLSSFTLTRVGDFQFRADGYLGKNDGNVVYGFLCIGLVTNENILDYPGKEVGDPIFSDQLVPIRYPRVETAYYAATGERLTDPADIYEQADGSTEENPIYTTTLKSGVTKGLAIAYPTTKVYEDRVPDDAPDGTPPQRMVRVIVPGTGGAEPTEKWVTEDYVLAEGEKYAVGHLFDAGWDTSTETSSLEQGMFTGISIDPNTGIVSATSDDTKETVIIGCIAVGKVTNPNGVTALGNNYYKASAGSGKLSVAVIGGNAGNMGIAQVNRSLWTQKTDADGNPIDDDGWYSGLTIYSTETHIVSNGLEMSKTDLAQEIAQMILTQRGYQANTRIITVTDSMLEELVNMKR